MGANQSQNRSQEDEDRFRREGEEMERKEREEAEAERQRAEEAARKAEEDRKRQEEENRRREEEAAALRKANTPFQKPTPPTLALTNKRSNQCVNCDIVIPPGLSSSTVILSRHIIPTGPKIYPEPMKASSGKYAGSRWENEYIHNWRVPDDPSFVYNADDNSEFVGGGTTGLLFISAFPDKDFPEVWVKGTPPIRYNNPDQFLESTLLQDTEMRGNRSKFLYPDLSDQKVILWNPSETKGDKGAVAINYKTHGALTKIFLKPTIPFSITYGINADVEKAERKEKERLKKKKEAEDKKKKKEEEEAKKAEGK